MDQVPVARTLTDLLLAPRHLGVTMLHMTHAGSAYRLEYRSSRWRDVFGKSGWFIVSGARREGPFPTREIADEIAFYDRHYG